MKIDFVQILQDKLVGKKVKHTNTHGRTVSLAVESVKKEHHHRQITPDTPQNDWWGESCDWDMIKLTFVDGSSKEYSIGEEIEIDENN